MNDKSNYFPIPHYPRKAVLQDFGELHRPDFLTFRLICNRARHCKDAVIGALKGSSESPRPASIFDPVLQLAKLSDFPVHISAFHAVEFEVSHLYAEVSRLRTPKHSTRAGAK